MEWIYYFCEQTLKPRKCQVNLTEVRKTMVVWVTFPKDVYIMCSGTKAHVEYNGEG